MVICQVGLEEQANAICEINAALIGALLVEMDDLNDEPHDAKDMNY